MSIRIDTKPAEAVCVVHLEGEVDIALVPDIRRELDSSMAAGCRNMVLDLTQVTYADSSALGLLVWIDHKLAPTGGKLVLVGANRDVTRVLELSGLVGVAPSISASSSVSSALEGLEMRREEKPQLWARSLTLAARIDELAAARQQVVEALGALKLPEPTVFDIKVAVGEALANAVRHGSPHGDSDQVSVDVIAYDDRLVIRVSDNGCGFTGEACCTGDVYAAGGRGVMFMRALMDRVDFEVGESGGTTVTLVKHLRSTGE